VNAKLLEAGEGIAKLQTPGSLGLLGEREREREREMGRRDGVSRKRWRWVAGAIHQGSTVCWVAGGDRWPAVV
jgi:hypothetical protein